MMGESRTGALTSSWMVSQRKPPWFTVNSSLPGVTLRRDTSKTAPSANENCVHVNSCPVGFALGSQSSQAHHVIPLGSCEISPVALQAMCEGCALVWGWEQVCVHNHISRIKFSPQANEITYLSLTCLTLSI